MSETTPQLFRRIAGACAADFTAERDHLAEADNPEALHQARVALRRLRALLSLFRPLVVDPELGGMEDELRWIAGAMREARELDVALPLIADAGVRAWLEGARRHAYSGARQALFSPRLALLLERLPAWLNSLAFDPAWLDRPAREGARFILDRARRRVKRRAGDPAQRHRLRIAVKQMRYAAEAFAPLHSPKGDAFRERLERLQTLLGRINDRATLPCLLEALGLPDRRVARVLDDGDPPTEALLKCIDKEVKALLHMKRYWR